MAEFLNFFTWLEWVVILAVWGCIPLVMWIARKQKKREREFRQELECELDEFAKRIQGNKT